MNCVLIHEKLGKIAMLVWGQLHQSGYNLCCSQFFFLFDDFYNFDVDVGDIATS